MGGMEAHHLVWRSTGGGDHELTFEGEVVASLCRPTERGAPRLLRTPNGVLELRRDGRILQRVLVQEPRSERTRAVFQASWAGFGRGVLGIDRRLMLDWNGPGRLRLESSWSTMDGEPLIVFHPRIGFGPRRADVHVHPVAAAHADRWLLIGLGWYLVLVAVSGADAAAVA